MGGPEIQTILVTLANRQSQMMMILTLEKDAEFRDVDGSGNADEQSADAACGFLSVRGFSKECDTVLVYQCPLSLLSVLSVLEQGMQGD